MFSYRIYHRLLVLVLFCGLQCIAVPLDCTFKEEYYWNEEASFYTCMVQTLDNQNNKMIVTEATGVHLIHETNRNVRQLIISNTKTTYLPEGIGNLFNLRSLMVYSTTLKEIHSKNFVGMDDLEYLYLVQNQLKYLSSDSFVTLKRLKKINLGQNQLVALEQNLFVNNLQLDYIWLNKNKVTSIGSNLFKHLKKLNYVDLRNNVCVNRIYSDFEEIDELKNDKESCHDQNEIQPEVIDSENVSDTELMDLRKENSDLKILQVEYEKQETFIKLEIQKLIKVQSQLKSKIIDYENEISKKNVSKLQLMNVREKNTELKDKNKKLLTERRKLSYHLTFIKSKYFNLSWKFNDKSPFTCIMENRNATRRTDYVNNVHKKLTSNSNVTKVVVKFTEMFYFPNSIFKTFQNLKIVHFQNASLRNLFVGDFVGASNLSTVFFNGNLMKTLDDDIFQGAEQLQKISINSNQIEKVSPNTFKGLSILKSLLMKDNLITELHVETFKDLNNLETLILTGNHLTFLDGKILEFNVSLFTLSVGNNKLEVIGEDILNYSKKIMKVDFSGNTCIDVMLSDTNLRNMLNLIKMNCKLK